MGLSYIVWNCGRVQCNTDKRGKLPKKTFEKSFQKFFSAIFYDILYPPSSVVVVWRNWHAIVPISEDHRIEKPVLKILVSYLVQVLC